MRKKSNSRSIRFRIGILVLFLGVCTGFAAAGEQVVVQMRLFQGFRGDDGAAAGSVVSQFSLKQLPVESELQRVERAKVEQTLIRVFNLNDTKIMADATMTVRKKGRKTPSEVVILNGRKLLVQLSRLDGNPNRFKVEVLEDVKPAKSLLETKILLPEKKSTVLGFEDSKGLIYFLSFHRRTDAAGKDKPVDIKSIKQPKLIKKATPKYPEPAKKAKVQGTVVINATTDKEGRVVKTKVINGHPLLRQAARDAVSKWVYEPYIVDGEKKSVRFTVVLRFRLPSERKPVTLASREVPKVLKRVEPKYPREALKKGIQGKVVLEVVIDYKGNVINAEVVNGIPELNQAALDAIKQWKYSPYILNVGPKVKKKPARFTVVVKFNLHGAKKKK